MDDKTRQDAVVTVQQSMAETLDAEGRAQVVRGLVPPYLEGLSDAERAQVVRKASTALGATDADPADTEWQPFRNALEVDAAQPLPDVVLPALAWRERLAVLSSAPKAGKSTVVAQAVEAALTTREFPGAPKGKEWTAPRSVAMITEEPLALLVARLRFYGGPEGDGRHVGRVWVASPRWGDARILAALERQSPDLVIVDSWTDWAVSAGAETLSDPAEMRRRMMVIREVANRGAAVLVVHHARRSDGAMADSRDLAASVDMIVTFDAIDPEMNRCTVGSSDLRRFSYLGRWPQETVVLDFDREDRRYSVHGEVKTEKGYVQDGERPWVPA